MPRKVPPFSAGDYTNLRQIKNSGMWQTVVNPSKVMLKARINQSVFGSSISSINIDTVTIYIGPAEPGWSIYFSHTDDIYNSYYRGRIRKYGNTAILYIDQTSVIPSDNDYVFVVQDSPIRERIPRKPSVSDPTIYVDYDEGYQRLPATFTGLPSYLVLELPTGTPYVEYTFNFQIQYNSTGLSFPSGGWFAYGGPTQIGGGWPTTATWRFSVTGWFEVRAFVIDQWSRYSYFAVRVAVVNPANRLTFNPELVCLQVDNTLQGGFTANLKASGDISHILPSSELIVYSWNDTIPNTNAAALPVMFGGRLTQDEVQIEVEIDSGGLQKVATSTLLAEGIAAQMERIILATAAIRRTLSNTSVFGEVESLNLWKAMMFVATQLSNLAFLHSLIFEDLTDTYAYPIISTSEASLGSTLSDLAIKIKAWLTHYPDGSIYVDSHINYKSQATKDAMTKMATFTDADWMAAFGFTIIYPENTGRVIAYGGSYNTTTKKITAYRAQAPSLVYGRGPGRAQVNGQLLPANLSVAAAISAMQQRVGAEYAVKNTSLKAVVRHPSGYYRYLVAAGHNIYLWTISDSSNLAGVGFSSTDYFWLESIRHTYNPERGMVNSVATYALDVKPIAASVMAEVAPETLPYNVPPLPPFTTSPWPGLPSTRYPTWPPAPEDEQPYNEEDGEAVSEPPTKSTDPENPGPNPATDPDVRAGNIVAVSNGSSLWICDDFSKAGEPSWKDITPTTGITDFKFDAATMGIYAISNNGSSSFLWRADNALSPTWRSYSTTGVYTKIHSMSQFGQVGLYSPNAPNPIQAYFDFKASQYNFVGLSGAPDYGTYIAGEGWARGTTSARIGLTSTVTTHTRPVYAFKIKFNQSFAGQCAVTALDPTNYNNVDEYTGEEWLITNRPPVPAGAWSMNIYDKDGTYGGGFGNGNAPASLRVEELTLYMEGPSNTATVKMSFGNGEQIEPSVGSPSGSAGAVGNLNAGSTVVGDYIIFAANLILSKSDGTEFVSVDETGSDTTAIVRALAPFGDGVVMGIGSAGSETLWIYSSGAKSAISPSNGGNKGYPASAQAIATDASGKIAMVGQFGGGVRLALSLNSGAAWDTTKVLNAAARVVRLKSETQLYIANGSEILYSEDNGVNYVSKTSPASGLTLLEVR